MTSRTLLLALAAIPVLASAGVNPRNGNFFIGYDDISLSNGSQRLVLSRTYNSKATDSGWFGYGWGSLFETRLVLMPDGSAAIKEHGTGQINFYRAEGKTDIAAGVSRLVEEEAKRNKLSAEATERLRKELAGAEEKRVAKVLALELSYPLPPGTVLRGNDCLKDVLSRDEQGYRRGRCSGGEDRFDLSGRLVFHSEGGSHGVALRYQGSRPGEIKDSRGQTIRLTWTDAGQIATAATEAGHYQTYGYDDQGNLTAARESKTGEYYRYSYDSKHNLTSIRYSDDTQMLIEYVSPQSGSVLSVQERNQEKTLYQYRTDPADDGHTWTKVISTGTDGAKQEREFEYRNRRSESGEERVVGYSTRAGKAHRSAIFDEKGRITGRVASRNNAADSNTSYIYHPRTGKLILVLSPEVNTRLQYDDRGNLTRIQDDQGHVVLLRYNAKDLVVEMSELGGATGSRVLEIRYDKKERPTRIEVRRVGVVNIRYGADGEMSQVDSPQGPRTAMHVSNAFQTLLNLVKATSVQK